MRLNESILKNLSESTVYRNTEDKRDYLIMDGDKLTDTSAGEVINDFGEFVGVTKVENTNYIVMRKNNQLYVYSFDAGYPFVFKEE